MFEIGGSSLRISVSQHYINSLQTRLHPAINQCYFTQLSYLQSLGCDKLIITSVKSAKTEDRYLVFVDQGKFLTCCSRLSTLQGSIINFVCEKLFSITDARFIRFDDIDYVSDEAMRFPIKGTSYQENWYREVSPNLEYLSNKQASNLRRKTKKLRAYLQGQNLGFEFRRCTPQDIDVVIAMNAMTLTRSGRKHQFSEAKQRSFKAICAQTGYLAGLYAGERLIAGDIITIVGDQVYFNVVGYDLEFAKFSPGLQVHSAALSECEKIGCTRANFLWGNSRWKSDLGAMRVPLTTLVVCRNRQAYLEPQFWSAYFPLLKMTSKQLAKKLIETIKSRRNRSVDISPV